MSDEYRRRVEEARARREPTTSEEFYAQMGRVMRSERSNRENLSTTAALAGDASTEALERSEEVGGLRKADGDPSDA